MLRGVNGVIGMGILFVQVLALTVPGGEATRTDNNAGMPPRKRMSGFANTRFT